LRDVRARQVCLQIGVCRVEARRLQQCRERLALITLRLEPAGDGLELIDR